MSRLLHAACNGCLALAALVLSLFSSVRTATERALPEPTRATSDQCIAAGLVAAAAETAPAPAVEPPRLEHGPCQRAVNPTVTIVLPAPTLRLGSSRGPRAP
jgi:hypothetical protein